MAAITYSDFWGPNPSAYSLLRNKEPGLDHIRRFVNKNGFRVNKALLGDLIGSATGNTVTKTYKRIVAGQFGHSIRRDDVETVTAINRATTAADVTALKEFLYAISVMPSTFPRDLSGNGGPALTPVGGE